jgi:hypothetical protein
MSLFRATGKYGPHFRAWPGHKEGDPVWCPEWTLGGCVVERCGFVHDNGKTPTEYVDWLCAEVKPGTDTILANPIG